jgi:hypothetical protein
MLPVGSNSHKVIYKRLQFSPIKKEEEYMLGKGINIKKRNFKLVLTMPIIRNLKIVDYPLPIFTN